MVEVLVDWGTEEAGLGFGGGEADMNFTNNCDETR